MGSKWALATVQGCTMELVTIPWLPLQQTLSCHRTDALKIQVSAFQVWVCVERNCWSKVSRGSSPSTRIAMALAPVWVLC